MTVSYGIQRSFFTSTIFVGRSAGSLWIFKIRYLISACCISIFIRLVPGGPACFSDIATEHARRRAVAAGPCQSVRKGSRSCPQEKRRESWRSQFGRQLTTTTTIEEPPRNAHSPTVRPLPAEISPLSSFRADMESCSSPSRDKNTVLIPEDGFDGRTCANSEPFAIVPHRKGCCLSRQT